jgi:phospholipid/cholesterol/gamma-HCH transport system substrate-binding protein
MVKGNVVQIAGKPVGTVSAIRLADNGQAELELSIDRRFAPLRRGTQVALRLASLSSPAGRYVDLLLPDGRVTETIPDGGLIDATQTSSATDLDHLFSIFDARTRRGLREVIRGQGAAYAGRGTDINAGWRYLNPSLIAAQRLFAEVNRDTPLLERFLVAQARLVTDVAGRRDDLAKLVDRLATATGAIAAEESSLARAVGLLPPFLRRADTTFVNLRATLDDAAPLVEESKPVAPRLRAVLEQLRPFARDAVPTVRGLAELVMHDGAGNDLIELARAVIPFRKIAVGPVQRNGAQRPGSFPAGAESLARSTKNLAFFRPYAVDFTGWLDDFSHSGAYDANGSFSRSAVSVNAPSALQGLLAQLVPADVLGQAARQVVASGQNNRCPGSIERGSLWKPTPDFNCDASQGPVGP